MSLADDVMADEAARIAALAANVPADWPHGLCECDGATCCGGHGPVAYEVERDDGRVMKVCTRCTLMGDKRSTLLVTGEDESGPLVEFDALGAMCIIFELGGAK